MSQFPLSRVSSLLQGYLTVHFDTGNYQKIHLAPLQEEALWCVFLMSAVSMHCSSLWC